MISFVKGINYKRILITVGILILLPIAIIIINSIILTIFNLGTDLGTTLRILFEKIAC